MPDATTRSRLTVGVDVGGTYTDLFFYDEATGKFATAKVPSTPGNQAAGFLDGLAQRVNDLARVGTIVHGTTVGTNALLERKGAPIGVITTKGFRDVLEMRRRDRPRTWGLWGQFTPVVPRDRRVEVNERTRDTRAHCEVARALIAMRQQAVGVPKGRNPRGRGCPRNRSGRPARPAKFCGTC